MTFKYNKQHGLKDCGASCLYNIIRYYNGYISFENLRSKLNTSKSGTSVFDIVKVSNNLGLKSSAYKCDFKNLLKLKLPITIHLKVNKVYPHFVILYKIKNNKLYIFDPVRGYLKYSKEKFLEEWSNIVITFEKTNHIYKEEKKNILLKNIKINKKSSILIIILSTIVSLISIIKLIVLSKILNNYNINNLSYFIFLSLLEIVFNHLRNKMTISFNKELDNNLMCYILKHIFNLPLNYHHTRPVGDIVSRIYDLYSIKDFINQLLLFSLTDTLSIIFIFIYLLLNNLKVFLLFLIISIIFFLIYYLFRDRLNECIFKTKESQSESNSGIIEKLLGIDTIKYNGLESLFLNKQIKKYNSYLIEDEKLKKSYIIYNTSSCVIKTLGYMFLFLSINLNISQIILFYSFLNQLYIIYEKIIEIDNLIINSKTSYNRINDLLDAKEEFKSNKYSNVYLNDIIFKNLPYKTNNFNLNIRPNDYIFITGESGIGKSTIFKTLVKEYKTNNIFLNNVPISKYSSSVIRNKITYVSQNEFIFTDTIKNNILLGRKIDKNNLNKALKVSMVNDILKNKNIDLDYMLEEDGHNISSGERQKILLARSLVNDTSLIIFDETMNEIDVKSERKIIKNIKTEYNKSIILISHRLDNKDLFNKFIEVKGEENE